MLGLMSLAYVQMAVAVNIRLVPFGGNFICSGLKLNCACIIALLKSKILSCYWDKCKPKTSLCNTYICKFRICMK